MMLSNLGKNGHQAPRIWQIASQEDILCSPAGGRCESLQAARDRERKALKRSRRSGMVGKEGSEDVEDDGRNILWRAESDQARC